MSPGTFRGTRINPSDSYTTMAPCLRFWPTAREELTNGLKSGWCASFNRSLAPAMIAK